METKLAPHNIYAESTPNPATMKFVSNRYLIVDGNVYEFNNPQEASSSEFAAELFTFPFVKGIFIASNFVSITKQNFVEWDDILLELKTVISDLLNQENGIQIAPKIVAKSEVNENEEDTSQSIPIPAKEDLKGIDAKIADILDEYVRPAVESDGGAIHFHSFEEGKVKVVLKGACSGCPSSTMTLKAGIENMLRDMLPEVKEVEAING